ncbi:hypothetical protein [Runella zeae]|uniref:hypothetical protein n=1 Tax=Runella zeae TaxID=94255 RepID=UPI00048AD5AF|nr:hypothetical protein [Runella zeae]
MEELALKELWQSYNNRLEESLLINKKNTESITKMQAASLLNSIKPIKIFAMLAGIGWVFVIDTILWQLFEVASLFFLISAGIQVILTKLALFIYLYQLIVIHQIDISDPVVATQEKLTSLRSSSLWVARILFLQLPVWSTFYLRKEMFSVNNQSYLIVNLAITLLFVLVSLWLFFNINYKNKDKKWFRMIFGGKEWDNVLKSITLYNDIQDFKK